MTKVLVHSYYHKVYHGYLVSHNNNNNKPYAKTLSNTAYGIILRCIGRSCAKAPLRMGHSNSATPCHGQHDNVIVIYWHMSRIREHNRIK